MLVTEVSRGAIAASNTANTQTPRCEALSRVSSRVSGAVWWPPLIASWWSATMPAKAPGKTLAWLFTVSKDGVFDPAPVAIQGVDTCLTSNRPLTAGDLYLLASQSRNKRGRAPCIANGSSAPR